MLQTPQAGTSPNLAPRQRAYVNIQIPGQPARDVSLEQPLVSIGRAPDNTIVLPLDVISGHHASLELKDTGWYYTDTSTNGSYRNGQRIPRGQPVQLNSGDILMLGRSDDQGAILTYQVSVSMPLLDPNPRTIHLDRSLQGKTSITLGRDPQSDIPLPAPSVSWQHARIDTTPQGVVIIDLGSSNGTFINGQRIAREYRLQPFDRIRIGPFRLAFDGITIQQLPTTPGVRLDGLNLTRKVASGKGTKLILNDVSICIESCEFVALVGPSGAGKSTLMKALSGFERTDGQVLVDGDDLYQKFELYRAAIGYVPQDDIIHKNLVVHRALYYAARLRLPPDTSRKEIESNVDRVLQQVEMEGHRNTPISRLSGGQRKRVSIAVELLANPDLFFLDEPTSGLDPGLEKTMMQTLRKLAKKEGQTIVLVTHATANIGECDQVAFLAQGRMVYYGPPREALPFFGLPDNDMTGFAEIYKRVDDPDIEKARQKAQEWETRYKQSPQYQKYVIDRKMQTGQMQRAAINRPQRKLPRVDLWQQFWVLTRRYINLVLRDPVLRTTLLAVMPLIGLCLALMARPSWLVGDTEAIIQQELASELAAGDLFGSYLVVNKGQQLLFTMALAMVLLGVFAAAYELIKEQAIYQRERMVTLRVVPYILSKIVVLGGFALIQAFLFLLVISLRVQLPANGVLLPTFAEMYISLVLGTLAAINLGLLISALVTSTDIVAYIVLVILFLQISFTGILFDIPRVASMPILTRWVVEGLGASVDMNQLNQTGRIRLQPDPVTRTVEVEVQKPDPNWKPFSVTTEMQSLPGCAAPVPVPQCTPNELVTVPEKVSEEMTVEPDAVEEQWLWDFPVISYDHTPGHLIQVWLIKLGFTIAFGVAAVVVLLRKDQR